MIMIFLQIDRFAKIGKGRCVVYANHLGIGVMNMERATQDGYITHRSIHERKHSCINLHDHTHQA